MSEVLNILKELQTVEDILKNLDANNKEIRNNAGGYYNHNLFFEILNPKGGGTPTGALAEAITAELGSFDNLQKQLTVTNFFSIFLKSMKIGLK